MRTFLLVVLLFSVLLYSPMLFAFLLFLVALFDVIYISDERDRVCPKCQEFIGPRATKCPFCNYQLPMRFLLRGRRKQRQSDQQDSQS